MNPTTLTVKNSIRDDSFLRSKSAKQTDYIDVPNAKRMFRIFQHFVVPKLNAAATSLKARIDFVAASCSV